MHKKINRVLCSKNIYFLLPDNFKGTIPEAFRLMADYMETPTKTLKESQVDQLCEHNSWEVFQKDVKKGGKLCGNVMLKKYDRKKEAWSHVHENKLKGIKFKKPQKRKK